MKRCWSLLGAICLLACAFLLSSCDDDFSSLNLQPGIYDGDTIVLTTDNPEVPVETYRFLNSQLILDNLDDRAVADAAFTADVDEDGDDEPEFFTSFSGTVTQNGNSVRIEMTEDNAASAPPARRLTRQGEVVTLTLLLAGENAERLSGSAVLGLEDADYDGPATFNRVDIVD